MNKHLLALSVALSLSASAYGNQTPAPSDKETQFFELLKQHHEHSLRIQEQSHKTFLQALDKAHKHNQETIKLLKPHKSIISRWVVFSGAAAALYVYIKHPEYYAQLPAYAKQTSKTAQELVQLPPTYVYNKIKEYVAQRAQEGSKPEQSVAPAVVVVVPEVKEQPVVTKGS